MNPSKEWICVIDADPKNSEAIQNATEQLCLDLNLSFMYKSSLKDLNDYLASAENPTTRLLLLIVDLDCLIPPTPEQLITIQNLYKTNLVVTAFEDPLNPLKKIETWPVENVIYKPFDLAILQEHLHFALVKNEKLNTLAVHSSSEKNNIEKIHRHYLTQIAEFGFTTESKFEYNLNQAYKFYHMSFINHKKSSQWGKAISKNKNTYEFIFCEPSPTVTTNLREKLAVSKNKIKNPKWIGFDQNKSITNPIIYIQMTEPEDFNKLKDYFFRKFPKSQVYEFPNDLPSEKLKCDLIISENEYDLDQINLIFDQKPLYFRITTDDFTDRAEAEKILATETIRLSKPIDRNYLGRMIQSFFPGCVESDPTPANWIQMPDPALHSEIIQANQLSEAAFIYQNNSISALGDVQEFAFSQDDETELKPIKAKIQFVETKPDAENKYLHQMVFFGIRDDMLKKIRLWMLQTHINHKKSGTG